MIQSLSEHQFPKYEMNHTLRNITKKEGGSFVKEKHVAKLMTEIRQAQDMIASGRIQEGRNFLESAIKYAESANHWD